jgi:KaiC/GvpD/RAD55 family RecA-like ATPase
METFGIFGVNYELKFLNLIIGTSTKKADGFDRDCRYGKEYVNILEPTYFDHKYTKVIVEIIKKFYKEFNSNIPYYNTIREQYRFEAAYFQSKYKDVNYEGLNTFLTDVQYALIEDPISIKKQGGDFLKTRKLREIGTKIINIADNNLLDGYEKAKRMLRDEQVVFRDFDSDVEVTEHNIIQLTQKRLGTVATRIKILDKDLNGGWRRKKPTLFFAGSNVGKTTISTVFASNALRGGENVVYISGEDDINDLSVKLLSHWTGFEINQISKNEAVAERAFKDSFGAVKKEFNNHFRLKHLKPKERNIDFVLSYLEMLYYDEGIKIDFVVIDYLDTLIQGADKWKQQMDILFKVEALAVEMDFAPLIIHQGKAAINDKRKLTREDMRGDTALFDSLFLVLYATKDSTQKGTKKGNFGILKSKYGDADLYYDDILLDNRFVKLDIPQESVTIKDRQVIDELLNKTRNEKDVNDIASNLFGNIKKQK